MDASASVVAGLASPAKALYVAAAAQALPRGAILYVVQSDRDLAEAVSDIGFFMSALDGLSSAAAEQAVLPFPSHEVDPYRGLAPHFGVTSARARALHSLATGRARAPAPRPRPPPPAPRRPAGAPRPPPRARGGGGRGPPPPSFFLKTPGQDI